MAETMLPYAPVLWWTATTILVHCPYCERGETRSFTRNFDGMYEKTYLERPALGLCPPLPGFSKASRYLITFPFSVGDQSLHYEIDREKGRFVTTLHVEALQDDDAAVARTRNVSDDVGGLAEAFGDSLHLDHHGRQPRFEDATEVFTTVTFGPKQGGDPGTGLDTFGKDPDNQDIHKLATISRWEGKTIDRAIQACITGETDKRQTYLDTTGEKHILTKGSNGKGEFALYLAAGAGHPDIITTLLDNGAEADQRITNGRTPLMEAALWGQAACVDRLLEADARADLKDKDGKLAIDLATQSNYAEAEREDRSAGDYHERRYEADRQRRYIRLMLRNTESAQTTRTRTDVRATTDHQYSFHSTGKGLERSLNEKVEKLIEEWTVPDKNKTLARLERGFSFPAIDAMSGWAHSDARSIMGGDASIYDMVQDLCQIINHSLSPDTKRDQGTPGRFNACHAEKKLVALLISKHRFTESDYFRDDEVRELVNAAPPAMLQEVAIYVSREVCDDCATFIQLVESRFCITIHTFNANALDQAKALLGQSQGIGRYECSNMCHHNFDLALP